jgi:hypothetical protein
MSYNRDEIMLEMSIRLSSNPFLSDEGWRDYLYFAILFDGKGALRSRGAKLAGSAARQGVEHQAWFQIYTHLDNRVPQS